ncbi:MAG TPA: dynamin family protein, partial [Euzebya sp.]|nr:dynamin family protein [Euzebya sp.]
MSARGRQATASIRPADERLADAGLAGRLDALEDAVSLLGRHGFSLPPGVAGDRIAHARARLRHGTHHTVVALVGSTGSGKSSLLNALVDQDVARAGVTRPTTAVTQAVTIGADASGLLDLIGITRRHRIAAATAQPTVPVTPTAPVPASSSDGGPTGGSAAEVSDGQTGEEAVDRAALDGLVLLDLPDFDSVAVSHRLEVDRLITLVDLLVWVTDPQKYADEALHDGYLRRFSGHADVMQVVLNKMDTLPPGQGEALLEDLARLLADDGLPGMTPVPTSAVTPGGVDVLRGILTGEVTARQAALERIDADLRTQAVALRELTRTTAAADGAGLPA